MSYTRISLLIGLCVLACAGLIGPFDLIVFPFALIGSAFVLTMHQIRPRVLALLYVLSFWIPFGIIWAIATWCFHDHYWRECLGYVAGLAAVFVAFFTILSRRFWWVTLSFLLPMTTVYTFWTAYRYFSTPYRAPYDDKPDPPFIAEIVDRMFFLVWSDFHPNIDERSMFNAHGWAWGLSALLLSVSVYSFVTGIRFIIKGVFQAFADKQEKHDSERCELPSSLVGEGLISEESEDKSAILVNEPVKMENEN